MAITHTVTYTWSSANGTPLTKQVAKSSGQEINIDESIPDSSSDLEVALAFLKDDLKSIFIVSDQALTLEFNNPADTTITLVANVPFVWQADSGIGNPFAEDVPALFVTNASGSAAALQLRVLVDPT